METVTNSFPGGTHLHRTGLRRSNEYTLWQRARKQREDDHHEGCGRIDPDTLVHIQSARCAVQGREMTDEVLEDTMWETVRPWEEQRVTLKVNEGKVEDQEPDDQDRHARFWIHRPDGFTVNEKE